MSLAAFSQAGFCMKVFCLQFGFVIFWQKEIGAKATRKLVGKIDYRSKKLHINLLLKLATNVNFTNFL